MIFPNDDIHIILKHSIFLIIDENFCFNKKIDF